MMPYKWTCQGNIAQIRSIFIQIVRMIKVKMILIILTLFYIGWVIGAPVIGYQ